jgi:hypothetical protein
MLQGMTQCRDRAEGIGRMEAPPTDLGLSELVDPRRDRALFPYTDECTAALVDEAVTCLVLMRAPMLLGDAGPAISVLVSLATEAEDRLFEAVASAREQGYTWDEIASRLGCSADTARRRYSPYGRQRRRNFDDGD